MMTIAFYFEIILHFRPSLAWCKVDFDMEQIV